MKTLWEKAEEVVSSIYILSSTPILGRNIVLFNPLPNKPGFLHDCSTTPLKTLWETEKLLIMGNFSISHSVFYPFGELPAIFIKSEFVVSRLSVWESLKFVVWERINDTKQKGFRKHWKKHVTSIFSFASSVFYSIKETVSIFAIFVIFRCFNFG